SEHAGESLRRLEEVRNTRLKALGRRSTVTIDSPLLKPIDREGARLTTQLESKRRALSDLEEGRKRQANELETRLPEQRAARAEGHPTVLDIRQSMDSLKQESPEVSTLRREIGALEEEVRGRGLLTDVPLRSPRARTGVEEAMLATFDPGEDLDPDV